MSYMTVCDYCGMEKHNKGFKAHVGACKRKYDGVKLVDRRRAPSFNQTTTRTFTVNVPEEPAPPPGVELTPGEEIEMAYRMFPDDSALFTATFHIFAIKPDVDPLPHLRIARAMIDLKIKSLGG